MYINQIKSNYDISNKGLCNSFKKTFISNTNNIVKQSPPPIKESKFRKEKIQKFAKKISDTVLKILDTL